MRDLRGADASVERHTNRFVQVYSLVYLGVMALLWATALPDFFGAVDGVTENGDPVGNLWYTIACFVVAFVCVAATFTVGPRSGTAPAGADRSSETSTV